jgi:YgiT-type zinc finger domain-containing protein
MRLVKTVSEVVVRAGRRRHRFENVPHEHCLACGERLFDVETSRRFDAVFLKGRRAA